MKEIIALWLAKWGAAQSLDDIAEGFSLAEQNGAGYAQSDLGKKELRDAADDLFGLRNAYRKREYAIEHPEAA